MSERYILEDKSIKGLQWLWRPFDSHIRDALQNKKNLEGTLAQLLASRGIGVDNFSHFWEPKIKNLMPDPSHLLGLDQSVERILRALEKSEKIALLGDYDVDGACSTSILANFLQFLGADILVRIPDRIQDGYGPSQKIMDEFLQAQVELVITMDCGSMAFDPLQYAYDKGLDVIVIDHHSMSEEQPKAYAIINPKRVDQDTELQILCAAGVTFMVMVALARKLKLLGKPTPDLMQYLDRVALATICDVVPLKGLNRAFVLTGLKILQTNPCIGLSVLQKVVGLEKIEQVYHLGFVLGPHINAGGRVGSASIGTQLLMSQNQDEAFLFSQQLVDFNKQRKLLEQEAIRQAQVIAQLQVDEEYQFLVVYHPDWHVGILGIIAGRLKDLFHKPVAVLCECEGLVKGSVRSIPGVDVGSLMHMAVDMGLLRLGGGHGMAAGLTTERKFIPELHKFLNQQVIETKITPTFFVDALATVSTLNLDFCAHIKRMGPFGSENPQPTLLLKNILIRYAKIVGQSHIKVSLIDAWGQSLDGICFRSVGTPLGEKLLQLPDKPLHCIGTVEVNEWNQQKRVQFLIEDIAEAA